MYLIFIVKSLIYAVDSACMFLLSFSIFRLPLRYAYAKVALISLVLSLLWNYLRDFVHFATYSTTIAVGLQVVLTMLFFRMPLYFSGVICLNSLLMAGILGNAVAGAAELLGWTSDHEGFTCIPHLVVLNFVIVLIAAAFIWLLQTKKIGFSFMYGQISTQKALTGYNFWISALLIIFLTTQHIKMLAPKNFGSLFYFTLLYGAIFLVFIWIAYKKNRQELKQKYEQLDENLKSKSARKR